MTFSEITGLRDTIMGKITQAKAEGHQYIQLPYLGSIMQSPGERELTKARYTAMLRKEGLTVSDWIKTPDPEDDINAEEVLVPFTDQAKQEAISRGYTFTYPEPTEDAKEEKIN